MKKMMLPVLAGVVLAMAGCQTTKQQPIAKDVSTYKQHMPKSILVLPPINHATDVRATNSFWPTTTYPIAEAGYYVFPVGLVNETFKQNGIHMAADAHNISAAKLREIFGADAALYIQIKEYGSKYQVLNTTVTVAAEATLVDLKTGAQLWSGSARRVVAPDNSNSGLLGAMVNAVITQVGNHLSDRGHDVSTIVSNELFTPTANEGYGLLKGPRHPQFDQ